MRPRFKGVQKLKEQWVERSFRHGRAWVFALQVSHGAELASEPIAEPSCITKRLLCSSGARTSGKSVPR